MIKYKVVIEVEERGKLRRYESSGGNDLQDKNAASLAYDLVRGCNAVADWPPDPADYINAFAGNGPWRSLATIFRYWTGEVNIEDIVKIQCDVKSLCENGDNYEEAVRALRWLGVESLERENASR